VIVVKSQVAKASTATTDPNKKINLNEEQTFRRCNAIIVLTKLDNKDNKNRR